MSLHLTLEDRKNIKKYLDEGRSMREIDKILGHSSGTTRRELKRNTDPNTEYDPIEAHERFKERKNLKSLNLSGRKNSELLNYVQNLLNEGLTPEQIVIREKLDITARTLYRYIYQGFLRYERYELKKKKA